MKLTQRVHLVGSGGPLGFGLTDPYDCHVYLVDGGDELALVDVGAGLGAEAILDNVRRAGFDPRRIRHLLLTHAHADHAGGAARMRTLVDAPQTYVSPVLREYVERADERGVSLDAARAAGTYPADYRLAPCAVDGELREGERVVVGDVSLRVLDTPGHADGHVCLLLEADGRRDLFAGDAVFHGGRIHLLATHDCRLDRLIASLRKLRELAIDGLFPGHAAVAIGDGQEHIERANAVLDALLIPEQLIPAAAA